MCCVCLIHRNMPGLSSIIVGEIVGCQAYARHGGILICVRMSVSLVAYIEMRPQSTRWSRGLSWNMKLRKEMDRATERIAAWREGCPAREEAVSGEQLAIGAGTWVSAKFEAPSGPERLLVETGCIAHSSAIVIGEAAATGSKCCCNLP